MSHRYVDGYLSGSQTDGYVRLRNDGYTMLVFDGYNIGFFTASGNVFNDAKGILYIPNRTAAPSGNPSGGGWFFVNNGDGYWKNPVGLIQSFTSTRIVRDFPSDADYIAVEDDYRAKIMEFTDFGAPLTANRDVILPNVSGYQWTVFNNVSGAFNLSFKVSGQAIGVDVAQGKRAIIYCNGTAIVRVTPDT